MNRAVEQMRAYLHLSGGPAPDRLEEGYDYVTVVNLPVVRADQWAWMLMPWFVDALNGAYSERRIAGLPWIKFPSLTEIARRGR